MNLYIKKAAVDSFESIVVSDTPSLTTSVYDVLSVEYPDHCIYMLPKPDKAMEAKILHIAQNQLKDTSKQTSARICLPMAAAYSSNWEFVGYMALRPFEGSVDLSVLTSYNRRPIAKMKRFATLPEWHNKFERDSTGMVNRVKMLCNIAIALRLIPADKYVIGNLVPENIMITAKGKVSIINLHDIQVCDAGKFLYPIRCFTPEYMSVDGIKAYRANQPISHAADLFAIAINFYQVLIGSHPYGGTVVLPPFDKTGDTIAECIEADLFPFGKNSAYITLPAGLNLHSTFTTLPTDIQQLFKRAFTADNTARPTIEEWGKVLYNYATTLR